MLHGLWQSEEEIVSMVASYKTATGKKTALKVQLSFRNDRLEAGSNQKR